MRRLSLRRVASLRWLCWWCLDCFLAAFAESTVAAGWGRRAVLSAVLPDVSGVWCGGVGVQPPFPAAWLRTVSPQPPQLLGASSATSKLVRSWLFFGR